MYKLFRNIIKNIYLTTESIITHLLYNISIIFYCIHYESMKTKRLNIFLFYKRLKLLDKYLKDCMTLSLNINYSLDISISIIIPHYNQVEYLDQCLLSIINSNIPPNETIVIDDCSDNQSLVEYVINKYSDTIKIIFIKSNTKLYAGGARQLGAQIASSTHLMFIDSDDLMHRDRIGVIMDLLYIYPHTAQITHNYNTISKDFNYKDLKYNKIHLKLENIHYKDIDYFVKKEYCKQHFSSKDCCGKIRNGAFGYPGAAAGHVIYRKEYSNIIKWNSPFNYIISPFEDLDFNYRLYLFSFNYIHIDLPLTYYRKNTTTNCVFYS